MRDAQDIAAEAFEAARQQDEERFLALIHPEAVLVPFTALQSYEGRPGAAAWLSSVAARYDGWDGTYEQVEVVGPSIVQHGAMTVVPRSGTRPAPVEVSWVWTIRDALVWRFEAFGSAEEARAAAQAIANG